MPNKFNLQLQTYNTNSPFEEKVNPSTIAVCGTKKNVFVQYVHEKQILDNSNWNKNERNESLYLQEMLQMFSSSRNLRLVKHIQESNYNQQKMKWNVA